MSSPHNITKSDVGLGNVENYVKAQPEEEFASLTVVKVLVFMTLYFCAIILTLVESDMDVIGSYGSRLSHGWVIATLVSALVYVSKRETVAALVLGTALLVLGAAFLLALYSIRGADNLYGIFGILSAMLVIDTFILAPYRAIAHLRISGYCS